MSDPRMLRKIENELNKYTLLSVCLGASGALLVLGGSRDSMKIMKTSPSKLMLTQKFTDFSQFKPMLKSLKE